MTDAPGFTYKWCVWVRTDRYPPPRDGSHLFLTDGTNVCWDAWWSEGDWVHWTMDPYGYMVDAVIDFKPLWWALPPELPNPQDSNC